MSWAIRAWSGSIPEFGSLLAEPSASGRIDAIVCGMSHHPGRAAVSRFSRPTAIARTGLLVRRRKPPRPSGMPLPTCRLRTRASGPGWCGEIRLGHERRACPAVSPVLAALPDPAIGRGRTRPTAGCADGFATFGGARQRHLLALGASRPAPALAEPLRPPTDDSGGHPIIPPSSSTTKRRRGAGGAGRQAMAQFLRSPAHHALVARFRFDDAEMRWRARWTSRNDQNPFFRVAAAAGRAGVAFMVAVMLMLGWSHYRWDQTFGDSIAASTNWRIQRKQLGCRKPLPSVCWRGFFDSCRPGLGQSAAGARVPQAVARRCRFPGRDASAGRRRANWRTLWTTAGRP